MPRQTCVLNSNIRHGSSSPSSPTRLRLNLRELEAELEGLGRGDLVAVAVAALLGLEPRGHDRVAREERPDHQLLRVLAARADEDGGEVDGGAHLVLVDDLEVARALAVVERELGVGVEVADRDEADVAADGRLVGDGRRLDRGVLVQLPRGGPEGLEALRLNEDAPHGAGAGVALLQAGDEVVGAGVGEDGGDGGRDRHECAPPK